MSSFSRRRANATRRLHLEQLEDRVVPALTATLVGTALTFQDAAGSNDSLVLRRDDSGFLRHDLFSQGVAGFESNRDLDSQTPGVQSAKVNGLQTINVQTGLGTDSVVVNDLGKSSVLQVTLTDAEEVAVNTGARNDRISVGPHAGHADVDFAGKEFHISGATEIEVNAQGGSDVVTVLTGDGDDEVVLGAHEGHLDVQFAGQTLHVVKAEAVAIDGQGGANSITVNDLSSINLPVDFDLRNAATVNVLTGAGSDKIELAHHQDHLDVDVAGKDFHIVGATELTVDAGGGQDQIMVRDLTNVPGAADIDLVGAEQVTFWTSDGDDVVAVGVHEGHLDVDLSGREFHVEGAQVVRVKTGKGADRLVLGDLSSITPPRLEIDGGKGSDTLDFSAFAQGIALDLARKDAQTMAGVTLAAENAENVVGTAFADAIFGNGAANLLDGGAGDDELRGLGGDDQLFGGTGVDTLDGGAGNNVIVDPDNP